MCYTQEALQVTTLKIGLLRLDTKPMPILIAGRDRVMVEIPDGHTGMTGPDGRMVPIPKEGYLALNGTDGRLVAVPVGWSTAEGRDGRLVAIPPGRSIMEEGNG